MNSTPLTVLVRNHVPECVIVHSPAEGYERIARRIAVRVREFTRARPDVIVSDDLTDESLRAFHAILIGSQEEDSAVARLKESSHWSSSSIGSGSYEVRLIADPLGFGKDVLVIFGFDLQSMKRGADSFILHLNDLNVAQRSGFAEDDLVLPPLDVRFPNVASA